FASDNFDSIEGQDERMANRLDPVEGFKFLARLRAIRLQPCQVAVDELDGLEKSSGRFALPNVAETTPSQELDEAIARDRLRAGRARRARRHFGRLRSGYTVSQTNTFLYERKPTHAKPRTRVGNGPLDVTGLCRLVEPAPQNSRRSKVLSHGKW